MTAARPAEPLRLPRPLAEFLRAETAGGGVLLLAAAVALAWANSPWRAGYEALWSTQLTLALGRYRLALDLRHWVNEGAMALFFLVVGLEIKRELAEGELRDRRRAALPVVAAAGGMVAPALAYAALNAGGAGARGWGVPMATDIAFGLGVLALLGGRVPPALKVFLLALAVVDDLGSILVVAVFYAGGVRPAALLAAAGALLAVAGLRAARVAWTPAYVACGAGLWLALAAAGVNPALAGAAMGLAAPATPIGRAAPAGDLAGRLGEPPRPAGVRALVREAREALSPAERLEHDLHPLSAFLVVPLFALANMGVRLEPAALAGGGAAAVLAGVVLGRVVGKLLGITAAVWLAVRLGVAPLPTGTTWRQLAGVATVAGVGLTVPLFVAGLAFPDGRFDAAVKLGLVAATLVSGAAGFLVLRRSAP